MPGGQGLMCPLVVRGHPDRVDHCNTHSSPRCRFGVHPDHCPLLSGWRMPGSWSRFAAIPHNRARGGTEYAVAIPVRSVGTLPWASIGP